MIHSAMSSPLLLPYILTVVTHNLALKEINVLTITLNTSSPSPVNAEASVQAATNGVMEFGEYLHDEILLDVPHWQWVFTIPKRLRPYFMHNR